MNLKYRHGTLADKKQLQKCGLDSYGQFKNILLNVNWAKMHSFLTDENTFTNLLSISKCFVCEVNNEIIGMAFLVSNGNPTTVFDENWAYIRMVGVNPEFTRNGIAKKLTELCIDYAIKTNEQTIALHTSEFMDAARHIYEGCGFVKTKELPSLYGKKYWLYLLDLKKK